jgi:hypothetical protein
MIGRAQGRDSVQLGKTETGQLIHWSFSAMTPNAMLLARRAFLRLRCDLAYQCGILRAAGPLRKVHPFPSAVRG